MKQFVILSIIALFSLNALAADCGVEINGDQKVLAEVKNSIREFQQAVINDNKEGILKSVKYPLKFLYKGKDKEIYNRTAFYRYYNSIFNSKAKKQIKEADINCLFNNIDGISIGSGIVWFDYNGKITRINN